MILVLNTVIPVMRTAQLASETSTLAASIEVGHQKRPSSLGMTFNVDTIMASRSPR